MNHNSQTQRYQPSPVQADNSDFNNILAHMPTPGSNDVRASSDANTFMSPLQVDQAGFDRLNALRYPHHGNEEVCHIGEKPRLMILSRCSSHLCYLPRSRPWMLCVITKTKTWLPLWILSIFLPSPPLLLKNFLRLGTANPWAACLLTRQPVDLLKTTMKDNAMFAEILILQLPKFREIKSAILLRV